MQSKSLLKTEYISALYPYSSTTELIWSASKLFFIPALLAWISVWFLNKLGVVFYRKNLEHKTEKDIATRQSEYDIDSYRYAKGRQEDDDTLYRENEEFNQQYDDQNPNNDFSSSEALFRVDPIAYKEQLEEWKREGVKDELRDEVIDEYHEDLKDEANSDAMRDK